MKKLLFALVASVCLQFSAHAQNYLFNVEQYSFVSNLSVTDNTVEVNVTQPTMSAIYPLAGTSFSGVFYSCPFWEVPDGHNGALWIRYGGNGQTITIHNSHFLPRSFYIRAGLAKQEQQIGSKSYEFVYSENYTVRSNRSITIPVPACSLVYYNNLPFGYVAPNNAGSLVLVQIMEAQ